METGLTRQIGNFIAELSPDRLPGGASDTVVTAFTDCIGVMLAGRDEPSLCAVREEFLAKAGDGRSSVLLSGLHADPATAALINGTAAHVLDYDDVALRGHPSAVLVPAILAEAEGIDADGPAMIAAYVAGYETWAELGRRLPKPLHTKGYHPTAIFGTLAVAAACANLRNLTAERAASAVAMAASQASGLTVNFGSDTKPFHVGSAAAAGLICARLAARGMTASSDALENPAGFLAAYGAEPQGLSEPADELGSRWRILEHGISIKRYPVCYAIHRVIDAIIEMRPALQARLAEIESIHIHLGDIQKRMLRIDRPSTPLEAKFSAGFCTAAALVAGNVGIAELRDDLIGSGLIEDLTSKITYETITEVDPAFSNYAPYDQVRVRMRTGECFESPQIRRCKGHANMPMSAAELRAKFEDCTRNAFTASTRKNLFEQLQSLPRLGSAADLSAIAASSIPSQRYQAASK
ncbi:MmgE/PrpD family protein [Aquamicrobium terrae]|uniref:2-methylcitrate dehydratase PrpD n=1 Tax=Aquamicrobium terrae TaxID=1324945 RepID=A0ABV2N7C6_9HYPH